jgi:hypothetical protein
MYLPLTTLVQYSSSLLFTVTFTPTPLLQNWFETGCKVNIVYGNLKSENSQDYAQKPQRNSTFINLASNQSSCLNIYCAGHIYSQNENLVYFMTKNDSLIF